MHVTDPVFDLVFFIRISTLSFGGTTDFSLVMHARLLRSFIPLKSRPYLKNQLYIQIFLLIKFTLNQKRMALMQPFKLYFKNNCINELSESVPLCQCLP